MVTTFTGFTNILPDPVNPISNAGSADAAGNPGPGFASVTVQSQKDTQVSRTISGRGVTRESGAHNWFISIKYNPMLRSAFDPLDAFLHSRNSRLNPFFVILPQYAKPKDPTFAAWLVGKTINVMGATLAGSSSMIIDYSSAITGNPMFGDFFTLSDPNNANHLKAYKITRVETDQYYQAGTTAPTTAQKRIWFDPPLQRNVSDNSVVNLLNPMFRVISTNDNLQYDLNSDNLYSTTLDLEEIQP